LTFRGRTWVGTVGAYHDVPVAEGKYSPTFEALPSNGLLDERHEGHGYVLRLKSHSDR